MMNSTTSLAALFERDASKERQVFTWEQLKESYLAFAERHELSHPPRFDRVVGALLLTAKLRQVEVKPEKRKRSQDRSYQPFVRYGWASATVMDIAASLRPGSYFSHGTAATLHGLLPAGAIYVNKEQSIKPSRAGILTQEGINKAFANAPRVSQYGYVFEGKRILLLSGKNTSDFEVIENKDHSRSPFRYTSLERTLFDIAVRPVYAGGVSSVMKAFHKARDKASIPKILKVMKHVAHLYPYHQAIGFYLHRAGFSQAELKEFKRPGLQFNFYLANKLNKPNLNQEWRIFVPADLE